MELLKVDSFELRTVDIADVEADRLHALSMAVGWRYHANEWCFLRQCGVGLAALDEIDRVVATAMLFPYDQGFATLGMVIVSPRLQGRGVAPWLVRQLLGKYPATVLRLNATDVSRRLFRARLFRRCGKGAAVSGQGALPRADTGAWQKATDRAPLGRSFVGGHDD